MKKLVYWLLQPASFGSLSLFILFALSSCGSDGEGTPTNDITIKKISPESPADLDFYETSQTDRVVIEYDYNISHADGARIFVQPFTDGSISPGYRYSSSSIFKGTGSKSVSISVGTDAGAETNVDQLRILIKNADQTEQLVERMMDVDYTFK